MRKRKNFKLAPSHKWRQTGKFDRNSKIIKEFTGNFLPMHAHLPDGWDDDYWNGDAKRIHTYLVRWFPKQVGRNVDDVLKDFKRLLNWKSTRTMFDFWEIYYYEPTSHSIDYVTCRWWKRESYTKDENNRFISVGDLDISRYTEEEQACVDYNREKLKEVPYYGQIYLSGSVNYKRLKYSTKEYYLGRFYIYDADERRYKLRDVYHIVGTPSDKSFTKIYNPPIGIDYYEWRQHYMKKVLVYDYDYKTNRYYDKYDFYDFGLGYYNAYYK